MVSSLSKCLGRPLVRFVLSLAVMLALSAPADAAVASSNSSAVIKYLPGYPGELPFYLETGSVDSGAVHVLCIFTRYTSTTMLGS